MAAFELRSCGGLISQHPVTLSILQPHSRIDFLKKLFHFRVEDSSVDILLVLMKGEGKIGGWLKWDWSNWRLRR